MVKYSSTKQVPRAASTKLDATFAALSDPTRRAILHRLSQGVTSVGELAEPFDMSLPAVSKHLRVLERAGLLRQHQQGRLRRCHLRPAPMREAVQWIERYRQFWTSQLGALAEFFEQQTDGDSGAPQQDSGVSQDYAYGRKQNRGKQHRGKRHRRKQHTRRKDSRETPGNET